MIGDTWIPLLPDDSLRLNGSQIVLPNPVLPLAHNGIGTVSPPAGTDEFATATFGTKNFSVRYFGPSTWDRENLLAPRYWALAYNNSSVGYSQFGPYNAVPGNETERTIAALPAFMCNVEPITGCTPLINTAAQHAVQHGPNIHWGAELREAGFATTTNTTTNATTASALPITRLGSTAALPIQPSSRDVRTIDQHEPSWPPAAGWIEPVREVQWAPPAGLAEADLPPPARIAPLEPLLTAAVAAAASAVVLLAVWAYTRLNRRQDALEHPPRVTLLQLVRANPGMAAAELTRQMSITRTAVSYHVRVLQQAGFLRVMRIQRSTLLYATEDAPTTEGPYSLLRRHEVCGRILSLLDARRSVARAEIHRILSDAPRRSRNFSINRLVESGLIVIERSAREEFLSIVRHDAVADPQVTPDG